MLAQKGVQDGYEIPGRVPSAGGGVSAVREKPVKQLATDLGISDATLHAWLKQTNIDEGLREGLTTDERAEIVRLRRANRVLEMELRG